MRLPNEFLARELPDTRISPALQVVLTVYRFTAHKYLLEAT